jgi:hypothetical protein
VTAVAVATVNCGDSTDSGGTEQNEKDKCEASGLLTCYVIKRKV